MASTIGIIGSGALASALATGWSQTAETGAHLWLNEKPVCAGAQLSARAAIVRSDLLVLVLPAIGAAAIVAALEPVFRSELDIVSCIPGVTLEQIRTWSGDRPAVFRAVANTAGEIRGGTAAIAAEERTNGTRIERVCHLFQLLGQVEVVPEQLLPSAAAVIGSAPTFLGAALEGMEDGAVAAGMPPEQAGRFVRQAALATMAILAGNAGSAADLKDRVSSPGGTTIAGLAVLEDEGARGAFLRAIEESTKRARQLEGTG